MENNFHNSDYRPHDIKTGGAYTGWRPRERNISWWHFLGLVPLVSAIGAMVLQVLR